MHIEFIEKIEQLTSISLKQLTDENCPFMSFDFLSLLESSGSVCDAKGWLPHHMVFKEDETIHGVLPLYIKHHSWGEYVFDWSWAQAYEDHQLAYYPKLVATVPFTPLTTTKLLSNHLNLVDTFTALTQQCQANNFSSWHVLFVPEVNQQLLPDDVYQRHTVQFHWFNQGYANFDDFLTRFSSRKRKNTRKERQSIMQQGIFVRRLYGKDVTQQEIEFFYLTYQLTYMKNGHQPHLTLSFFKKIFEQLANNLVLIIASKDDEDIACALFFYDEHQLYGRYWGAKAAYNNLHFELCYYQGIEFCIEHKLQSFNPGTQGEHKIQRGFEPVLTHSYHWIKHQGFKPAIKDFCQREREHMHDYLLQCQKKLPFKTVD